MLGDLLSNSVFWGVLVTVGSAVVRINIVVALVLGSLVGGLVGGLSLVELIQAFQSGLAGGTPLALTYALVGGFASALAYSGVVEWLLSHLLRHLDRPGRPASPRRIRRTLIIILLVLSLLCKSLFPMHIAFIPILIPPLLPLMNRVGLDRRMVACVLAFGLVVSYMIIPYGFGHIFLNDMLMMSLARDGLAMDTATTLRVMAIPCCALAIGLAIAVFFTYSRPHSYDRTVTGEALARRRAHAPFRLRHLWIVLLALVTSLVAQALCGGNMIVGTALGILVVTAGGIASLRHLDATVSEGIRVMALVGMIVIAAAGFNEVLRLTGGIDKLVILMITAVHGNRALAVLVALLIGLVITLGLGTAFATVPIVSALFVPLGHGLGLSPFAIMTLVAVSAVLGEPGSPLSSTTLGPTSGLGFDGQFDHLRDCVWPTFLHFNGPLLILGWLTILWL
ncbi:MAG: TRAP transporter large permease subunit [Puniceicoccales bacterium]|jgi:predicted histidine transporter YuiF (NhaC family)|nr:TRAP transporter large permease subunit [Puniceicoccales bacterium]